MCCLETTTITRTCGGCSSLKCFRLWGSEKDSGDHVCWGLLQPSLSAHVKYEGQSNRTQQVNLPTAFPPDLLNVAPRSRVGLLCIHSRSLPLLFAHPSPFFSHISDLLPVPEPGSFLGRHCGCDSSHTGENGMTFTRAVRRRDFFGVF